MMNLRQRILPLPCQSAFKMPGHLTWGGSMVRTPDGLCHLYVSRWPRTCGHNGWVTHSEIVHAVADDPLGPYRFHDVALGRRRGEHWDRDVAHNPTVLRQKGRFYLYYTGNHGNGEYWDHRNHQRIGVAVASRPEGPWERFDAPLLDVNPSGWDALITTNPSCTPMPDGRFLLMYKAAGRRAPLPMGGPVLHGVAFADSPLGPFRRHPAPLFAAGDANFPAEDPFVWSGAGRLYAILKDQGRFYSAEERALVLFESGDGRDWRAAADPVVVTRTIALEEGGKRTFHRLERPQLYCEEGVPRVLFCAVKPRREEHDSWNIHLPLRQP
jgi:hypothetical protein